MVGIRRLAVFLTDYVAKSSAGGGPLRREEHRGARAESGRVVRIPAPACGKGQVVKNAKRFRLLALARGLPLHPRGKTP